MSKPVVHANIAQLKGAFRRHSKLAEDEETDSSHLLRFYANECGLKAIFMWENKLQSTRDFETSGPKKKYGHGHDLLRWVAEIKIPGFVIPLQDNKNDPLINTHEKLRYGVGIQPAQKSALKAIHSLLKKHLK